jgi:hypothetical protein
LREGGEGGERRENVLIARFLPFASNCPWTGREIANSPSLYTLASLLGALYVTAKCVHLQKIIINNQKILNVFSMLPFQ